MMRLLRVVSVVAVVFAVTSAGRADLVAHWTFDETSGPALDSSGNGYHGTIVGSVGQGLTGRIGGAYAFSGTGWVDGGVDTVTSQITDFPITVCYWLKSTAVAGTECAVWMGNRGSDSQYLQSGMKNGNANAGYRNTEFDGAAAWKDRGTTATEADGQWHHIAAVYPSTSVRHVYVDGVLADTRNVTQPYFAETNQVAIGNNNRRTSLTDPFDGLIDDVQIYDEALTTGEIGVVYSAGCDDVAGNPSPVGRAVDPAVPTMLSWDAPRQFTPESGYNLVLRKAVEASEPNFAAPDNIIEITDATAVSPVTITLDYDSTYYWRVDSYEPNGIANDVTDDILRPGIAWSFSTLVSVPVITADPEPVFASENATAEFQVGFQSVSTPEFAWYKSVDASNATIEDDIQVSTGSSILTVSNVTLSDEGFYYCVVVNQSGTEVRSDVASLNVKQLLAWYQFENDGLDSAGTNHGTPVPQMNYTEGVVSADGQAYAAEPNGFNYVALASDSFPKSGLGNGLTHFTYSAWVKLDIGDGGVLLGSLNSNLNTGLRFSVNTGDGSISCFVRRDGNVSRAINVHNLPIADSEWHHVAVTNDGSQLVAYLDGLPQGSAGFNLTEFAEWEFPMYLLAINSRGTADQNFKGKADDLRIYNHALSADEVMLAYYNVTGKKVCAEPPAMDLDGDCVVDIVDLSMLSASWLENGLRPID